MSFWEEMKKEGNEFTGNLDRQRAELEEKRKYLLFYSIQDLYNFLQAMNIEFPKSNSTNPVTGERYGPEITSENLRNKIINEVSFNQILEFARRSNIF
jgi:hypothetical protein